MVMIMKIEELKSLVEQGESETLEFKESSGLKDKVFQTLCAFLNHRGGIVLIGIRRDSVVIGQNVSESTLHELCEASRKLYPSYRPTIERLSVKDGSEVIIMSVPEGQHKPYVYDGVAWIRQSSRTERMRPDEHERLLMERASRTRTWDSAAIGSLSINDIDIVALHSAVEAGIYAGRIADPLTREPKELLRGLGLIDDNNDLLNASVLLFGKPDVIKKRFPQCLLKLARFRGTDIQEFIDDKHHYGNIYELLKLADGFLRTHLPSAGRIVPNLFERKEDPLFPPVALREALANAVVHRDYADPSGSISIAIFDDRTEIANSGRLLMGLSVGDLYKEHGSKRRNPLIAEVFHQQGIIEQWGRGTREIVRLCESAGHPRPDFLERGGEFVVKFRSGYYVAPLEVSKRLTERQRAVLKLLGEHGSLSLAEITSLISTSFSVAKKTIADDLSFLLQLGEVLTTGHGRGARWRLTRGTMEHS
jgi:ATP-dependent DNA helicase RecG